VKGTVPLVKAHETALFGSKAVLGQAMRDGPPVPPFALSGAVVEAVAAATTARSTGGEDDAAAGGPLAVRSPRPTRTARTRASPVSTSRCSTSRRSTT
jgi:hypothetical protein